MAVRLVSAAGCASSASPPARPVGALEARYRVERAAKPNQPPATATAAYRGVIARGLGSRCRMLPSDSELFDRRAHACGALAAAVLGIARLMLEIAAGPDFVPVTTADGRIRWLDNPAGDPCAP